MSRKEIIMKASQKAKQLTVINPGQPVRTRKWNELGKCDEIAEWRRGLERSAISWQQTSFAPESLRRFLTLVFSSANTLFRTTTTEQTQHGRFLKEANWINHSSVASNLSSLFKSTAVRFLSSIVVPGKISSVPMTLYHPVKSPALPRLAKVKRYHLLQAITTLPCPAQSFSSSTTVVSDDGLTIRLNTSGYKKENIRVEVESNWLVVEALSTSAADTGGFLQRYMMRRFELPPLSDVQNIRVELNEMTRELEVHIPKKPKMK